MKRVADKLNEKLAPMIEQNYSFISGSWSITKDEANGTHVVGCFDIHFDLVEKFEGISDDYNFG